MKLAIMQPYFFPYIGYFQLMSIVDEFIVYDNIQFSRKGWVNRNRILVNERDVFITLPLKKDSDYLNIVDRQLAEVWPSERNKLLNRLEDAYRKAPNFFSVFPLIEKCILYNETNLFHFILNSLKEIRDYLQITTPFFVSSEIDINHNLKAEEKVIALCKARKASIYVNPIGGFELYNKSRFMLDDIELRFHKTTDVNYPQFSKEFVPFLSIIDVMMFNSVERIREFLKDYTIQ